MNRITTVLNQYNNTFRMPYQKKKTAGHLVKLISKKTTEDISDNTIVDRLTRFNKGKLQQLPVHYVDIIAKELRCNTLYLQGFPEVPYKISDVELFVENDLKKDIINELTIKP